MLTKEMAPNKSRKSPKEQKTEDKSAELSTTQYLVETVKQLQAENENLKLELTKSRRIPSGKIGIIFLIPGILSLAFSIYVTSSVLAFIGLGLTFWGALFFFVRPIKYVQSTLLDSTAITSYSTIDRIIKDLNYKGKSFYIPPYPKDIYLPEYLKGLKNMIVFISADSNASMPSIEEMAKSRFLLENPKGISIAPPGLGLLTLFEKELKTDLTGLNLNELYDSLSNTILEHFQLAKEIEIKPEKDTIHLKIVDSTYKDLYSREENLKSIHLLGCPIVSAVACAIAKATGKMVTIVKDEVSLDNQTIQVWLQILGA
ncbi:MAG: hypothetical protein NWE91_06355 [Candidatus Bathyarchaeota archaeon]|nr:hypothetical protein [Candidatus Bathyarchaeota archaeon]